VKTSVELKRKTALNALNLAVRNAHYLIKVEAPSIARHATIKLI
jgi:hypothetical protein